MIYNLNNLDANNIYQIMAQSVIPRPIAWIVTSNDGIINIAPFSFFTPLSSSPASVIVSIEHKSDGSLKDTITNIKKNKKCTICMVDEHNLQKMHFTSQELPHDISESQKFDINTQNIFKDFPPMVENCSVAYACTFNQIIDLGRSKTIPVVLNVKEIYVSNAALVDKNKPSIVFKPVARVAREYSFLSETIQSPKIK